MEPDGRGDPPPRPPRIVGILLAAGRGRRYDPSGERSKLLAPAPAGPWHGSPLAVAAWRNLRAAEDEAMVVVRAGRDKPNRQLRQRLVEEGACLIECGDADQGIAASLVCGVRASAGADGWLIALADMPAVHPDTIRAVADALRNGHASAAPRHRGQRGHPVGFSRECLDALTQLRGDQGARAVLDEFPPALIDVDDPGCLLDVDTTKDAGEPT